MPEKPEVGLMVGEDGRPQLFLDGKIYEVYRFGFTRAHRLCYVNVNGRLRPTYKWKADKTKIVGYPKKDIICLFFKGEIPSIAGADGEAWFEIPDFMRPVVDEMIRKGRRYFREIRLRDWL